MSDRITAHNGKAWIDGVPIDGYFTIEVRNDARAAYGGTIKPAELDVEVSKTLTIEDPADRALFEGLGARRFTAEFEVWREIDPPPAARFALWGGRRGSIQIGSLEDRLAHAQSVRVTVPNVELARGGEA